MCEGVDDALAQVLDYVVQAANVLEAHWNLLGRDQIHGDGLFIAGQLEVFWACAAAPSSSAAASVILLIFGVVLTRLMSEHCIESTGRGRCLLLGFFFLGGFGIETVEERSHDEEC